jgi:hypothetical protein
MTAHDLVTDLGRAYREGTLENRTVLSGGLDEGDPVRSLATFRSRIAPSGGGGMYSGCDCAAKIRTPNCPLTTNHSFEIIK